MLHLTLISVEQFVAMNLYFAFNITSDTGLCLLVYFVTSGEQVSPQAAGENKARKTTKIIIIALLSFLHVYAYFLGSSSTSYVVNVIVLIHPVFV